MPYLNTPRMRQWLAEHDRTVRSLAPGLGMSTGALKEAVSGRDPIRWARIQALAAVTGVPIKVLVRPGTAVPTWVLVDDDEEKEGVKEEKTHPDKRKGTSGPKRATGAAA